MPKYFYHHWMSPIAAAKPHRQIRLTAALKAFLRAIWLNILTTNWFGIFRHSYIWHSPVTALKKKIPATCIFVVSGSDILNNQIEADKSWRWQQQGQFSMFHAFWLSKWHKQLFTSFGSDTCAITLSLNWSIYITFSQRITPLIWNDIQ